MSNGQPAVSTKDNDNGKLGLIVVMGGLAAVTVIFAVAALRLSEAAQLAALASAAVGVIGTIVGAYFGVQAGASGRERAEQARDHAEARAFVLAGAMDAERYAAVRSAHVQLFGAD